MWTILRFLALTMILGVVRLEPCVPRDYGANSVVCVCNATYCDFLEPYSNEYISNGNYLHYTSSMAGLRLQRDAKTFVKNASIEVDATFQVDRATKYQEIIGFGGALTDSTAINIHSMSEAAGENILRTYFGEGGSKYSLIRVPMGASDFSTEYYTYDDVAGDTSLQYFALRQFEDYHLKIPYLKQILKMSSQDIKLFTAPWSAPYWMKDNGTAFGRSALRLENYKPWAQYFVKYFDAYADANITFWGLTPQNEPNQGGVHKVHIISMGWTAKQLRGFIAEHLGPALEENGYSYLKLMAYDDSGSIFLNICSQFSRTKRPEAMCPGLRYTHTMTTISIQTSFQTSRLNSRTCFSFIQKENTFTR